MPAMSNTSGPQGRAVQAVPPGGDARLDWERDGADWPNRAASRFVTAGGLRWHVQVMGQGPVLLLLHGTGASTHSWRDLTPMLAKDFTVVAPDLPGHGFTAMPASRGLSRPGLSRPGLSLPGMAGLVRALLDELGYEPEFAAGHSAGAAILVRLCIDQAIRPQRLVALNGALLPLGGLAGMIFSPMAKVLAGMNRVPHFFARCAESPGMVQRLLHDTGSRLDATGTAFYSRLARSPGHVAAALGMMAEWDLYALRRDLPRLRTPLHLIVGGSDGTIPPADAFRIKSLLPRTQVKYLRGLGHLAHEEAPAQVALLIRTMAGL